MTDPDATRALGASDFAAPQHDRYFEDYVPGSVYEYGWASVSHEDIVEFATRFDPQRMHVDAEWAAAGPYHGLIASGFHTAAIFMRLFADHYVSTVAGLASPGIDELRWTNPVRPGDRLRLRTTILAGRVSRSRPDRGVVETAAELITSEDLTVLTLRLSNFVRLRSAGD